MFRAIVLCQLLVLAFAAPPSDLITSIPGLSQMPKYKMYSGYLSASDTKHFFYWFAESQKNPAKDPLVLWLNGGPGCSSLLGFLNENGPLHIITDAKTAHVNKQSWNKLANMLYIESPAGVGFSYDDNNDMDVDDDKVSQLNYNALIDFLKKFPEYSSNKFFITGESYGGIYLPNLAVKIFEGNFEFNLQGMAIGNPWSNYKMNDNSMVFFAYFHGFIGETLWEKLTSHCCNGMATREKCNFADNTKSSCMPVAMKAYQLIFDLDLNPYAIFDTCGAFPSYLPPRYQLAMSHLLGNNSKTRVGKNGTKKLNKKWDRLQFSYSICYNSSALKDWLNRKDVKSALHVNSDRKNLWVECSAKITYTKQYQDMTPQYHKLLRNDNFRVLLYNGDTDMVCNFLGNQWFADSLKQPQKRPRSPWYVDGQVAGFVREYEGLTFTTIRGAGHLVPQSKPSYALAMFDKFINDQPLN